MIKRKISNKVYKDVKEFEADLMLMFNNARRYNAEGSAVYDDANTLQVRISLFFNHFFLS